MFCREGLGEGYDGDIAFASSLEMFGGGHNDPISIAFGGLSYKNAVNFHLVGVPLLDITVAVVFSTLTVKCDCLLLHNLIVYYSNE